ncbi:iron ABC transporter permease [Shewanella rhizosphaerae]|uniref:FecCD family ABC transporter permease n=1 Tax=Shewanella rhizosphaerae TaxID=2864207 RepID=UPI001C654BD2|nr:iron ABC transporter permease [Shewanella rhizosphaerae]QYK13629.1 iron ABC transporter permease [Shewanella rhizosphaerae]
MMSASLSLGRGYSPLQHLAFVCLGLLTLATPVLAVSFGAAQIGVAEVLEVLLAKLSGADPGGVTARILIELRLPRILLAFIAGFGLALAGAVLQTVTRNPLADPYLFGISSGASLGAVVVITLLGGVGGALASVGLPLGAFIGASLAVLMVLALCGRDLNTQIERMLLSGVAISFLFGALASLMLYFSGPQSAASVLFWSLGSFAKASWQMLWLPWLLVLAASAILLLLKRQILAIQAGDETAHTLGIRVQRLRLVSLLLCSLITAVLVANCGGIGFVGLMVPHMVRLLLPGRFALLLTALVGGLFMIWVDVLARCLLSYQELPVGIITAVIGSLFFLFILGGKRGN